MPWQYRAREILRGLPGLMVDVLAHPKATQELPLEDLPTCRRLELPGPVSLAKDHLRQVALSLVVRNRGRHSLVGLNREV